MKKNFLFTMAIVAVCSGNAQKPGAARVPAAVKSSFEKKYPGLVAKWENENGQFEAGFKQNGKKCLHFLRLMVQ